MRERPPVAGVVATEALPRALEEVADEDPRGESVPVVPRPAVRVREWPEEQRRVRDASGDHDVGTLRERVGDRTRAEICGREQRGSRAARRTRAACRGGRTAHRPRGGRARRGRRSSPRTVAIVMPVMPSDRAVSIAARAAAGGVDAAGVGDDLRAPLGDVRQRAREIGREIARVAARFVALPILLEDRERELGERLEAEEVDAVLEERVGRGRRVAVEALTAGDGDDPTGLVAIGHDFTRGSEDGDRPTAARPRPARRPARGDPPGTVPPRVGRRPAARLRSKTSAARSRVAR